jgi:hypothetical protein
VLNLAFRLRLEQGERSLSGDHFEYYNEKHYVNIIHALERRKFTPSSNGKLVKLNCGMVIDTIQSLCRDKVCFERDTNGSHTGLFGLYGAHTAVMELLRDCILEHVAVSEIE